MTNPLRRYVLRGTDGLWCGAHPYDTRAEADAALATAKADGFGADEVVELCEVCNCNSCARWNVDGSACPVRSTRGPGLGCADWEGKWKP